MSKFAIIFIYDTFHLVNNWSKDAIIMNYCIRIYLSELLCLQILGWDAVLDLFKGLIMDGCVLLTSTPECVVSPRGETTHEGVDVNNTHPSMINPDYNMILANLTLNSQYFAY